MQTHPFRPPRHPREDGPVSISLWSRDPALVGSTTVVAGVSFHFVPPRVADPFALGYGTGRTVVLTRPRPRVGRVGGLRPSVCP